MKYGARNQIIATVANLKEGDVMSQVSLDIPAASSMTSVMTTDSLRDLGLARGDQVKVIVKAIHVLVVRE
jgi:molybdate transport system regulatory protein